MSEYSKGFAATQAALEQGDSESSILRKLAQGQFNQAYIVGCESAIAYWKAEGKAMAADPLRPRPGSVWLHRKGNEYTVIGVTDDSDDPEKAAKFPVTVFYRGPDGRMWPRLLDSFLASFTFRRDAPTLSEEARARYAHMATGFFFGVDIEQLGAQDLRTVIGYLLDPKTIR